MSDSLRDLVVSLSLNTDNFTRNIKSVNKQIQEAESNFKLASAGVDGFETSAAGLSSKLATLERKLQLQKDVVTQYERALAQASGKLTECYNRQTDYAQRLDYAQRRQATLSSEVAHASDVYETLKAALGETDAVTVSAGQHLEQVTQEYNAVHDEVVQLTGQQDALRRATQNAADAVSTQQTQLNKACAAVRETEAAIADTTRELRTAESAWTAAGHSLEEFSSKCKTVSESTGKAGRVLSTIVTAPITALGTAAMKSSIEFESAFTGVRKTVDASEQEFDALEKAVKRMSTEIAASTTDIAEVMAIAGQLGIHTDALEGFTRVMIDLGNSTDINAQNAGSTLAKFANIMGMDQSLFENLGSTLVDLGNNYATTESAIMEMSLRLAGAGKQVGLSEAQILGFATALSSVGIEAQMGGSSLSKALIKMEVAAASGGQALTDFANVCGMTEEQFVRIWESDPAAVFQQFIEGLAKMDEEGISAISVLDDIGIKEIRLRDTMLRAVNATELFTNTQRTAKQAWAENTALATEAGKRYATTESKLTNLKNKAVLFTQQIGDDLNPTFLNLIDGADALIEKFMAMDEEDRLQIIKMAALAAGVGPALTAISKLTKGLSAVTGGIGKFATAVGAAGGGFSGFISVLASSPAVWFAVAAAAIVGTVALVDYASGAKQAREALEGMEKTARDWKDTAADTFYNQSGSGLSFFGMSTADFKKQADAITVSGREWLNGLITVWTDGKVETNEIVSEWTSSFKAGTEQIRANLEELKQTADQNGYTNLSSQMESDLKQLDRIDAEISRVLKNRQNGYFSDADKIHLQELIDTREALQIKYSLVLEENTDGFDTIRKKLEAEVARAQALGKEDADVSAYENAVVAAAQGLATVNQEIDANYDKAYALLELITDNEEQEAALAELNQKYSAQHREAALEYAALLKDVTVPVFRQDNIQKAAADMNLLTMKLREYSAANETDKPQLLAELNELASDMDESSLVEYIGLLTQIQSLLDVGISREELDSMFPEIDVTGALNQIAAVEAFLKGRENLLPGLASMIGEALPEEIRKIAIDLDMTQAQARWDEFAENPGAVTTDAIIASYSDAADAVIPTPTIQVSITGYDLAAYRQFVATHPVSVQGIVRLGEVFEEPGDALEAEKVKYWKDGVEIPATMVPTELLTPEKVAVLDTDGTMHILLTTELSGSQEVIEELREEIAEVDSLGTTALGRAIGIMPLTIMDRVEAAMGRLASYERTKDYSAWDKFWAFGESTDRGVLNQSMLYDFDPTTLATMTSYVSEVITAIQAGDAIAEEDYENLQKIMEFLKALELADVGENVTAGIGEAMAAAGWESDAESVASHLEDALNAALLIQSPSKRMKPIGEYAAAGVGEGAAEHSFQSEAGLIAASLEAALVKALNLRSVGMYAMYGLALGIQSGQSMVTTAMRNAALSAVWEAKNTLQIRSPSRVFRNEVGVMTMRGFGEGVLAESKSQAKIIRNAARFLTGEAKEGAIGVSSTTDNRSYDQSSNITLSGNTFSIRDEQDVYSLAVEIASLTKRQQAGRGLRAW